MLLPLEQSVSGLFDIDIFPDYCHFPFLDVFFFCSIQLNDSYAALDHYQREQSVSVNTVTLYCETTCIVSHKHKSFFIFLFFFSFSSFNNSKMKYHALFAMLSTTIRHLQVELEKERKKHLWHQQHRGMPHIREKQIFNRGKVKTNKIVNRTKKQAMLMCISKYS